ncbi:MAG: bis-aminopropyl spermidine synthase family protein [Aquificae bacterium]|nr:bis-aminopropyl spermidine synthase family protein [Aquificota bacterium]
MIEILEKIAKEASEKTNIKLYRRSVERILSALQVTSDFWKIVDYADQPVPAASEIIKLLIKEGYVTVENEELYLTEKGLELVKELGIPPYVDYTCQACEGRGIPFYANIDWYRAFVQLTKDRPKAVQEYDQGSVTPETTVSRVLFLDSREDLRDREILVMGAEDDLTGLAVALTGLAKKVLILDIDERAIEFDNKIFKELGINNAEARVFDLRNPFPEEWIGAFDVFITDPPETVKAFKAFIARGISALKGEGSAGYFGLTLRDSSINRWQQFQRALINDYGMVITDIIQDFNAYMNWEYHDQTKAAQISPVKKSPTDIWYRSAWYRIEALPGFKGENVQIKDEVFRELYLDEEGSTT